MKDEYNTPYNPPYLMKSCPRFFTTYVPCVASIKRN